MHAPGLAEEQALVRPQRLPVLIQQVLEGGAVGALRMRAATRLLELHGIAEQHEIAGGSRRGQDGMASDIWPASSTNR
jgi:hypothetical protein